MTPREFADAMLEAAALLPETQGSYFNGTVEQPTACSLGGAYYVLGDYEVEVDPLEYGTKAYYPKFSEEIREAESEFRRLFTARFGLPPHTVNDSFGRNRVLLGVKDMIDEGIL